MVDKPTPEQRTRERLRRLPKVDKLAGHSRLATIRAHMGDSVLNRLARGLIAELRSAALEGQAPPDLDAAAVLLCSRAAGLMRKRAQRVINATGVVLHTNLGRAPLSRAAVEALAESAGGYTSVELDLLNGRRGARGAFAESALAQLCGAEAALVVNNNAAAVLLALTTLAQGRGVLVSRGEQVEIGGGFRVPEVLARSGAKMIEIGTTNRTRLSDYARVLDGSHDVAVVLRVHPGNFRQTGFVARPGLAELAQLARERGAVLVMDLGGGALIDLQRAADLRGEPVARECIAAGAQLVCFSCDKVLGGPQGGAVVGEAELVGRLRRDPLARALRLGRLPLVALEASLEPYLRGEPTELPTIAALTKPLGEVRERVQSWCQRLADRGVEAEPVVAEAQVGGGALAEEPLPSVAAHVRHDGSVDEVARRLRAADPPVLARIADDRLLLDGRTVLPGEDELLIAAVLGALVGEG